MPLAPRERSVARHERSAARRARSVARRERPVARRACLGVLGVAAALVLSACTGSVSEEPDATDPPAAPESVEIPDTPVGKIAQSVVDALNAEQDSTASDWEGVFDDTFTAEVPLEDFASLLNAQFRPAQPFTVTAYEGTETQSVTTLHTPLADPFDLTIVLGGDGLVSGLLFTPAEPDDWEAPASFDELERRLEEFPATVRAAIVKLGDNGADAGGDGGGDTDGDGAQGDADAAAHDEVLLDLDSATTAPLGSVFKLYVLLAVAEAIDAGTLTWGEELEVTDEVRSLPSGELQDEPAGTRVTVSDAAMKMISISDNTATDMLIHRVGREAVEAAVVTAGHHDPAQMAPFMTTRELFHIGWGDAAALEAWRDGDTTERRALLETLAAAPLDTEAILSAITGAPVWPDGAEWFASPQDIVRVHHALDAIESPEIAAILSENPGVAAPGWQYVAFKGGSSPGVVTGSWLVRDASGNTAVVVMQASTDAAAGITAHQLEFFRLAESALGLVRDAL